MSKLILFLADGTTMDVPLRRERTTMGRRPDNDVCLPNLAVSGEHAAVVTILADSFLEDLGSTNGTLVNGKPIAKHFLRDGDHIDIGRHVLVYCVDDNAVLAADLVQAAVRATAGVIGNQPEARPVVRASRDPDGSTMRRQRVAANAAATRAVKEAPAPSPPESAPQEPTARIQRLQDAIASVKVLSGPGAGRLIPITKDEVTIGRAGVQVALIRRSGEGFQLKPIEGEQPVVNATAVPTQGVFLNAGDVIEIAGAKLEFGGVPEAGQAV
jgi:hypothetical protein